jgi:beta-glucuronidase
VGAANYHSWFWVNGKKVCEHEGGFTAFNCEVTSVIHAGGNFVVAAVDNTRHEDNVPTLRDRLVELWRADARGFTD